MIEFRHYVKSFPREEDWELTPKELEHFETNQYNLVIQKSKEGCDFVDVTPLYEEAKLCYTGQWILARENSTQCDHCTMYTVPLCHQYECGGSCSKLNKSTITMKNKSVCPTHAYIYWQFVLECLKLPTTVQVLEDSTYLGYDSSMPPPPPFALETSDEWEKLIKQATTDGPFKKILQHFVFFHESIDVEDQLKELSRKIRFEQLLIGQIHNLDLFEIQSMCLEDERFMAIDGSEFLQVMYLYKITKRTISPDNEWFLIEHLKSFALAVRFYYEHKTEDDSPDCVEAEFNEFHGDPVFKALAYSDLNDLEKEWEGLQYWFDWCNNKTLSTEQSQVLQQLKDWSELKRVDSFLQTKKVQKETYYPISDLYENRRTLVVRLLPKDQPKVEIEHNPDNDVVVVYTSVETLYEDLIRAVYSCSY